MPRSLSVYAYAISEIQPRWNQQQQQWQWWRRRWFVKSSQVINILRGDSKWKFQNDVFKLSKKLHPSLTGKVQNWLDKILDPLVPLWSAADDQLSIYFAFSYHLDDKTEESSWFLKLLGGLCHKFGKIDTYETINLIISFNIMQENFIAYSNYA